MIAVFEALNRREGTLIAGYLCDHGVPAELQGGAFQSVEGELPNIRGILPRIFVLDDGDEARAKELLKDYADMLRNGPQGEPWACPGCGETHEPQFLSCWKCQAERPA